jgi:type II secretory pathway component PulM
VLRSREKIVLALGAAAVVVILLLSFVVIPGVSKVRSLSKASVRAEKDLEELRKMLPDLSRLDREVRRKMAVVTASANAKESPLTRLTGAIQQAGLPQSAFSLKSAGPRKGEYVSEEAFDLKVENLTYLEMVRLLKRMESGQLPVVVRSATLKSRYDDSKYLDGTLRIGFLLPAGR